MNETKVSRKSNREREKERAEVRVFWSELKLGGNGGEGKRNFRSKKSFFFVFSFSQESEMKTTESGKENPRKCCVFHFNGILVILIIG